MRTGVGTRAEPGTGVVAATPMPLCRVYITLHYISSHVYFISTRTAGGGTRQTGRDSSCDPRASVRVSILGYCLRFVISSRHINQKTVTAHGAWTTLPPSLSLHSPHAVSLPLVSQQLPVALLVEVIEMSPEVLLAVHCLLSGVHVCGDLTTNHDHCARPLAPVACWHCPAAPTPTPTPAAAPTPAASF